MEEETVPFRPRSLCRMNVPIQFNKMGSLVSDFQMQIPTHSKTQKEYSSTDKDYKPIQFHSKGILIRGFGRKNVEELQEQKQEIDFENFLTRFQDEEELDRLKVEEIFDVDFETIEGIRSKVEEFLEAAGSIVEEKEKNNESGDVDDDNEFLMFLNQKNLQIKENEMNFDIVINNIDKIRSLEYDKNSIKVYFNEI